MVPTAELVANGVTFHVQRLQRQAGAAVGTPCPLGADGADAPPVVFIHGLFIDNLSSLYYSLANPVAQAGADAILYDMRGHGRTERTQDGYTLDESVDDLLGLVDGLGIRRPVHLVGHSYGASVALRAGLRHPERVASLVLIEPHCSETDDGGGWVEDIADALSATALSFERFPARDDAGADLSPAVRRKVRTLEAANSLLNETTLIEDVAAAPPFGDQDLAVLAVPVMAVYGEHTDLASSVDKLARCMPGCRLEIFPGVGHSVLRDAAGKVLELLVSWLRECATPVLEPSAS